METDIARGRRTGRPDTRASQELDGHILAIATRLFTEQGYAATSMEQIAAAAGSGKQTIYRRYPSKEDLFKAVTGAMATKIVALATAAETTYEDPLTALREACRASLDFVSKPEVIAIYRILIAELERFPALIDHTIRAGSDPYEGIMRRLLQAARNSGRIHGGGTTEELSHALSGLVTGWAVQKALLGQRSLSDLSERAAYFETAWLVFLRGVSGDRAV
jgi:AcrR family transcriptional regulator